MPWLETAPMEERMRSSRTGSATCTRWSSCARGTASAGRPATSGSIASSGRGRTGWAIGAARRTSARTASPPTWRRPSAPRAGSTRAGGRTSSCTGWSGGTPTSTAGPQHGGRSPGPPGAGQEAPPPAPLQASRRRAPDDARPNDLWTADFKGHFRTRDGIYCYPLTVADQHTRYLLACHGLLSTKGQGVRPVFERLFREYGLPRAIRTDNGVPFATTGIHGLSQLNVWWMRLGIQHQRIRPASPQDNGAHERMHKTLKAATARPPQGHLPAQQRAFNRFRADYNDERPHQFLGGRTPGSLYQPSPRPYTGACRRSSTRATTSQARHERRDVPVQAAAALHRQRAQAAPHRPRGGRRRDLVHLLLSRPPGPPRRTRLCHPRVRGRGRRFRGYHGMAPLVIVALRGRRDASSRRIHLNPAARSAHGFPPYHARHHQLQFQQVSPMFPVNSVTYLPGCTP